MITSIQGTLASSSPLGAVIEVGGFGYEVHMPATSAERLPRPGATLKLHTLVIYREDAQTLYGFTSPEERDFFRLLIENVTGVGPKMALSIMSRLALPSLEAAIRAGDINALARCPGIGKKTAERLVVELRTKVGGGANTTATPGAAAEAGAASTPHRDAVAALMALGYKSSDADTAVRRAAVALGADADTSALIRRALNG